MDFGKVAKVTNLTNESFTHSYGGQPFTLQGGESKIFPYEVADHLATHLARKIMLSQVDRAKLGIDEKLWSEGAESRLKAQILGEQLERQVEAPLSEAERIAKEVEELNKFQAAEADEGQPVEPVAPDGYKDKAEVIEELKKLGVPVNARLSKAKLEEQLAQALSNSAGEISPASRPSLE